MFRITNMLFDSSGSGLSIGEKFSTSFTTLLLGMLVVFSVLLLIMLVITIVGKIFQKAEKKKAEKAPETPAVEQPAAVVEEAEADEDTGELIAAITAAVAVCMEQEPGTFRVVSFKKTNAKPAWNKK